MDRATKNKILIRYVSILENKHGSVHQFKDFDESEETEVKKDIEWLKKEIRKLKSVIYSGYVYEVDLMSLLNQLDEPEVLPKREKLESKIKVLIEAYEQEDGRYSNPENAWICGFIADLKSLLEEEQKYYICLPNMSGENKIYIWYEGKISNYYTTNNKTIREVAGNKIQFTEQEIKDYDLRYWIFRKPVEELEE